MSVTCCWVGDSRAIIVTPDKRVWELSTDHNLGNEREQSRIEMESSRVSARTSPRASLSLEPSDNPPYYVLYPIFPPRASLQYNKILSIRKIKNLNLFVDGLITLSPSHFLSF